MTDTAEIQEEATGSGVDRRSFLKRAGFGVAGFAASSAILAACSGGDDGGGEGAQGASTTAAGGGGDTGSGTDSGGTVVLDQDLPELEWEMGTSWPTALVTIFGGAQEFADMVGRLTGGKFKINVRPAGEIVGGLEVLPTVRDGGMEMGHTASYYYVGLSPVQQFGTAVPFGLTQRQQNAWLYQAGGLELLNEFNAEEHGIIAFPAGSTGCQMGGWFSKEINTVSDLQGLKMRIPGLAGQVLNNLGGEQVTIAGGEILTSIETGAIDAAEFVGPTDDLILGLDQLGSKLFYYYPGWWEPGTAVEVEVSLDRWNDLPAQYQAAIEIAARSANTNMMAKYDTLNPVDLQKVKEFAELREFSPELMAAFKEETENVLDEVAAGDPKFASILGPWREFRDSIAEWHGLAERSYLNQQTQI
ncbi:MAG TPA: ABC transporter substrate-binding protein [Acidimicrobiales bacterium]|nr:ABC transporter substrate-binding protein [Acidimicrobiales bacterium]